jgi:hypothetical protein
MKEQLEKCLRYGQVTEEGIIFDYELVSMAGAAYYLFPGVHHTMEDIENGKQLIYNSFDALYIRVLRYDGEYPIPREPEEWTPEQREGGFRKIVREGQFGRVENCTAVDLFTANSMVQVLDNLSPENKTKMLSMNALAMITLMWKLLEKGE